MFYFQRFSGFFTILVYHWRNWNADMFIHFNPVSVCLVEVAESTDYLFDWYIDNMMLYDMIWYDMACNICILGSFGQQMNSGDLSQAGNLPAPWWQFMEAKILGFWCGSAHCPRNVRTIRRLVWLNPLRTSETFDTPCQILWQLGCIYWVPAYQGINEVGSNPDNLRMTY